MWEAIQAVGAVGLWVALVVLGIGLVRGIWRKRWKVLIYGLGAFTAAAAVFAVATELVEEPVEPDMESQGAQATLSVACPTPAEKAYFLKVTANIAELRGSMPEFGRLNTLAGENPYLFLDDEWKTQISALLVTFGLVAEILLDTTPPESATAVHKDTVALGEGIEEFVRLYTRGVDNLDAASLEAAGSKLASLGVKDETVSGRIRHFCE